MLGIFNVCAVVHAWDCTHGMDVQGGGGGGGGAVQNTVREPALKVDSELQCCSGELNLC